MLMDNDSRVFKVLSFSSPVVSTPDVGFRLNIRSFGDAHRNDGLTAIFEDVYKKAFFLRKSLNFLAKAPVFLWTTFGDSCMNEVGFLIFESKFSGDLP